MAAGIDGARLMKVARLRTDNGNGTALEDLEKLLEEAKGSKRKDQEVRFGGGDNIFWQLEMVEADRDCVFGRKTEGKRRVRSSVAESLAMFVIFRCV
jgi:hypothetical protein